MSESGTVAKDGPLDESELEQVVGGDDEWATNPGGPATADNPDEQSADPPLDLPPPG